MNQSDLLELAKKAISRGDIIGAEKLLTENLRNSTQFEVTRLMLAEIEIQRGNTKRARALLLELEQVKPAHPHTLTLLAYLCRIENDRTKANSYLQRALVSKNLTQNNLQFIADELVAIEDYPAAINVIKQIDPMDPKCFHNLGLSYFKIGEVGKALPIYRKLSASFPDSALISRELSLVAAAFREYETAIDAYKNYMSRITPSASDYLKFADLELMGHNVTESEQHLNKSIELGERSIATKLLQAKIYRLKGDYQNALDAAREIVQQSPQTGTAWSIIAELTKPDEIDDSLIKKLASTLESSGFPAQDLELTQFALAELYTKRCDYKSAYRTMHAANQTKIKQLKKQGSTYNRTLTQKIFDEIKSAYRDHENFSQAETDYSPVFIVGMPRSGTTVINRVIESCGKFHCIGESEAMPYIHAQIQHTSRSLEKFFRTASSSDWNKLAESYRIRAKQSEKPTVDKMPSNFLYVGEILSMFPKAKIIQLRRSPFDVCMSIFAKPFPDGHNYACSPDDLAHYYFNAQSLMDFWTSKFPDNVWNLDFEQFLDNPGGLGSQLFRFLGEDWSDAYLAPSDSFSTAFTFSEIQVRKKINKRESTKWQPFVNVASDLVAAIGAEESARH